MESKTCGECRYYVSNRHGGVCTLISDAMCNDDEACDNFEKPTNGDKIRSMSNEELASLLVYTIRVAGGLKFMYSSHLIDDCFYEKDKAISATLAKLKEVAE